MYQIPADDQQVVRDNLLESLIRAPHMVQLQLGEVFKTIVYADFHEKWPTLPQSILPNLVSQVRGGDGSTCHGGTVLRRYGSVGKYGCG